MDLYARDAIAKAADEIGKLRGAVLILGILCFLIVVISVYAMSRRQYPIIVPGYSDKPVYISENDAPPEYMRMIAEYASYLTQTYSPADYLGRHEYVLKYFAPGAQDSYEKYFMDEYKNIIDKDRISARFEPSDFRTDMKKKSVMISGFITLMKDGVEETPEKMDVEVVFSKDPYQPKISSIVARILQN